MTTPLKATRVYPTPKGLGDAIAAVATPIARALGMPCVDKATGQLKPDSPCAKRKEAANKAVPFRAVNPSTEQ